MSDTSQERSEARRAIVESRKIIAESEILSPEFRTTSDRTFAEILASFDGGRLTAAEGTTLAGRIMEVAMSTARHRAFQDKQRPRQSIAA